MILIDSLPFIFRFQFITTSNADNKKIDKVKCMFSFATRFFTFLIIVLLCFLRTTYYLDTNRSYCFGRFREIRNSKQKTHAIFHKNKHFGQKGFGTYTHTQKRKKKKQSKTQNKNTFCFVRLTGTCRKTV